MTYQDVLSMVGGLCLFLFGMQLMGGALEKSAGSGLSAIVGKLTTGKLAGFLTGLGVTAAIQSSSATTVMVVGFVNSGIMSLGQAINVIMGANVGTTVTAWLLSLTGISSSNPFIAMLKPANFTPLLAIVGIVLFMMSKTERKKDIGMILLGFTTLMFGMETMSAAVSGLRDVPEFQNILIAFSNPLFGVVAGAILTAVIQSSSASVGILQALSSTGQVTVGTAIPIVMGQNIGTCVTALISAIGANKNARRTAVVHLSFNIIGCAVCLVIFTLVNSFFDLAFTGDSANAFSIAVIHSVFNIVSTAFMLPLTGFLEKLAYRLVPEKAETIEEETILDPRLFATPAFAVDRSRQVSMDMAKDATTSINLSLDSLSAYKLDNEDQIVALEDSTDKYEDLLGSYLVKLSEKPLSTKDSRDVNEILHIIGDFERIADHSVSVLMSVKEITTKGLSFSASAVAEIAVLSSAVRDIVNLTYDAYTKHDAKLATKIEPLEQVVDSLKEQIRSRHIKRLQAGNCSLEMGFVLSDILANLGRVSDHCSNIAGCIIEMEHSELDIHTYLGDIKRNGDEFKQEYITLQKKYTLPA